MRALSSEFTVLRVDTGLLVAVHALRKIEFGRALLSYTASTWKKRLFRLAAGFIPAVGWLATHEDNPLEEFGVDASAVVGAIERVFAPLAAGSLLTWPRGRKDRVHIHVLDVLYRRVGFAKLGFAAGSELIDTEAETLRSIFAANCKTFKVPRVLERNSSREFSWLACEALPPSAQLVSPSKSPFPEKALSELGGKPRALTAQELRKVPWLPSAFECLRADVRTGLTTALSSGVRCCRIHGDFGSENLFRDGETLWIVDWERSVPCGPALTDRVAYWLGGNLRLARRDPVRCLERLVASLAPYGELADVCAALAFLSYVEFGPARSLFYETTV